MFLKTKSVTTSSVVRPLSFNKPTSASRTLASAISKSVGGIQSNLEHEHPAVSLTEGGRLAMILYNKPFQVPSFNVVLEWDVEVLCLPPMAHLQTRTTHKLVLRPAILGQR
jgi:hypothetical protein